MIKQKYFFIVILCLIPGLSVFWGCTGTSPRTDYYVLNSLPGTDTENKSLKERQGPAIGIGPLTMPPYLDRQQIVTRSGPNEVEIEEFHRWAEPLKSNIGRVLKDNLSTLLNTDHVVLFPWTRTARVEYQVFVDIERFDVGPAKEALLEVRWAIIRAADNEILRIKKTSLTAPIGSTGYAAIAAAQSQTLADFSREVAASISDIYDQEHGR